MTQQNSPPPKLALDTNALQWSTWWPGSCSDPWRLFRRQDRPGTSSDPDVCRCFRRNNIWSNVLLLDEASRRLHLFFAWWGHPGWKLGCKNSCVYVREDIFYLFDQFYIFCWYSMQGRTCLEGGSASERATWLLNVFENLQSISNSCGLFCKGKACINVTDAVVSYFKIENLLLAWGIHL